MYHSLFQNLTFRCTTQIPANIVDNSGSKSKIYLVEKKKCTGPGGVFRSASLDVHYYSDEDADPFNRSKYPSRPSHHHRLSSQFMQDSSAAQRYSPMNTSSAASYVSSPKAQPGFNYNMHTPVSRQSPTRASSHDRYAEPPTPNRFNPPYLPSGQRDMNSDSYFNTAGGSHAASPRDAMSPGSTGHTRAKKTPSSSTSPTPPRRSETPSSRSTRSRWRR